MYEESLKVYWYCFSLNYSQILGKNIVSIYKTVISIHSCYWIE